MIWKLDAGYMRLQSIVSERFDYQLPILELSFNSSYYNSNELEIAFFRVDLGSVVTKQINEVVHFLLKYNQIEGYTGFQSLVYWNCDETLCFLQRN